MRSVDRIKALSAAIDRYGQLSLERRQRLHTFGNSLINSFKVYMGEQSQILGIPPRGEWSPDRGDYRDAKFGDFGKSIILIKPIEMGIALKIPNCSNNGAVWMTQIVILDSEGSSVLIELANSKQFRTSTENDRETRDEIHEEMFQIILRYFEDPVERQKLARLGRIGF